MDLLDFFTKSDNTTSSLTSTTLSTISCTVERRRKARDTISEIPIFENTLNRLDKAKRKSQAMSPIWN